MVSYYHHLAAVRGWCSAIINIILLWAGVGGRLLLASSCWRQGLVVSYQHHLALVAGEANSQVRAVSFRECIISLINSQI